MGLDIVEFVMGAEEAFGVRIPDDVASSLATPRMLINYLHSRLPKSSVSGCLSQRAFYAVRRAMVQRLGLPRSQLCPDTELLAVLPPANAQAAWAEVGESLGASKWPRARSGGWLARVFLHARPRTLGDAARHVATFTPCAVKQPGEGWSWGEVVAVVDGLMRYHFAIREYSLDDSFVEDLGLD
jgi:acyl carrier protein